MPDAAAPVGFTDSVPAPAATTDSAATTPTPGAAAETAENGGAATPPAGEGGTPAPEGTPPKGETSEPKTEPKPDDRAAAVRAAARASHEARQTKAALAKIQNELTEAKAQGAKTAELQAELDAIKADPYRLLKALDPNDVIQKLLDAEAEDTIDPRLAAVQTEVQALKTKLEADAKAKDDAAKAAAAAEEAEQIRAADARLSKRLETLAEDFPLVKPRDAATIRQQLVEFCESENWAPSQEEMAELIRDAAKQIHEERLADLGPAIERLTKKAVPAAQQKPHTYTGIGFTDDAGQAAAPAPAKHTPAPATTNPGLPARRVYTPIGFTD